MLNITRPLFVLVIALYLVGCKRHSLVEWPVTEKLEVSVKGSAKPLKAEIVEASYDFIYAKDFFVYQDSIMIVLNKANVDVYFVEFYNLNSDKIINRFIRMGNGPGEMLNTLAHVRRNELFVHDFAKNQIVSINIDSVLYKPDYRIESPIRFSNNVGSPFVTFYRYNELIMQNPFHFYDRELRVDNKVPRFITTENGNSTRSPLLYIQCFSGVYNSQSYQ
ncbi:MAG: hypothetical protein LBV47_02140 [Bacteroidales bacterium]|jgi:hypothetical protein|nr:hypothetical protein [Bacteroidales bacterium]